MLISFYRVIKFAFQNFWRNIWLSFATIIILTLTFLTISFLLIFNVVAKQSIKVIEDKIDISVYFKQDIAEEDITQSQFKLLSLPWTKNIKYISREQAFENFKIKHFDNNKLIEILKELEENPLGASLIITAKDMEGYNSIIDILSGNEFNEKIQNTETDFNNYKRAIERISFITTKVKQIGAVVSIILAFIAILIVFYTIKIAIYTHKEEIAIMKLVGAGNAFIKAPFLIESIIYTILSCLLSLIILYPLIKFLNPHIEFFVGADFNLLDYFKNNSLSILGWPLLGAIALNLISSTVALGKYLKV
ncbi:MAG: permease-like cell division protein FtsX [bacterium]